MRQTCAYYIRYAIECRRGKLYNTPLQFRTDSIGRVVPHALRGRYRDQQVRFHRMRTWRCGGFDTASVVGAGLRHRRFEYARHASLAGRLAPLTPIPGSFGSAPELRNHRFYFNPFSTAQVATWARESKFSLWRIRVTYVRRMQSALE